MWHFFLCVHLILNRLSQLIYKHIQTLQYLFAVAYYMLLSCEKWMRICLWSLVEHMHSYIYLVVVHIQHFLLIFLSICSRITQKCWIYISSLYIRFTNTLPYLIASCLLLICVYVNCCFVCNCAAYSRDWSSLINKRSSLVDIT